MQSHILNVHVCLAVTYHLRFWQNDQVLLRAAVVIRNKSAQRINPGEENSPAAPARIRTRILSNHESGALTTELSRLPVVHLQV